MVADQQLYKKRVDEAEDIPTLSAVVTKINEMVRNPSTSAADVGTLISQDPALTAKTLKLVNSSFYGFPKKINNITHAIVILGFNKVKNIAITASVLQNFERKKDSAFDFFGFWEHSIGTAIACEVLAKNLKSTYQEDAFVAGLLHDIGKLVLSYVFPKDFDRINAQVLKEDCLMVEAENDYLGFNHSLLGLWLTEKWNFPESLCTAIRMHHNPLMARQHRDLVYLIHVADILTRALSIGNGGDEKIPELTLEIYNQMKLNDALLQKCLDETMAGLKRAGDFFELIRE